MNVNYPQGQGPNPGLIMYEYELESVPRRQPPSIEQMREFIQDELASEYRISDESSSSSDPSHESTTATSDRDRNRRQRSLMTTRRTLRFGEKMRIAELRGLLIPGSP